MTQQEKLGIIQLRGAGDCLIAVPVAKYLFNKGYEIHWVIDKAFYEAFKYAVPYVTFYSLQVEESTIQSNIRNPYWFETPRKMLIEEAGCQEIISFPYEEILHFEKIGLPSRFIDQTSIRAKYLKLSFHTTFDQFKYAVCNVPFKEKWNLDIRRNKKREEDLFNKLVKDSKKPYIVTHLSGAMGRITFPLNVEDFCEKIGMTDSQVINITNVTDNIFDWTTILERCSCFIGLDSFFVNLVDQLNMQIPKFFIRRSPANFTPVLGNSWDHYPVTLATDQPHDLKF